MTSLYGTPAWIARLSEPQRSMLLALTSLERELEDSAPIDRLRLLAIVRQAQANARAAWGEEESLPCPRCGISPLDALRAEESASFYGSDHPGKFEFGPSKELRSIHPGTNCLCTPEERRAMD